jgi:RNA polymerase sigma-70 factor (ECF subfamily)
MRTACCWEATVREFQTLYQEHHGYIYRFVYKSVKNHEDAEDLTLDIFLKAVRGVRYERGAKVTRLWLVQVARTTIADYWRARSRLAISSLDALLEDGGPGPRSAKARSSDTEVDRVQRLLAALPQRSQDILTCRFLHSLSLRETAYRMGITVANVKVLQFRVLKRAAALERGDHRQAAAHDADPRKTRNKKR